MRFNKAFAAALAVGGAIAAPVLDRRQTGYGGVPVRGVNIGGWLVLEPWITPSIFDGVGGAAVDEYTLCQNVPNAESILQAHWSSWATEGDFQRIAGYGFNMVRIPVGYWAFKKYGNDPYIQGANDYLSQAIGWARGAGLKVWIDLHGAPLSQNGFDNSGQRTDNPQWSAGDTVEFTVGIIDQIASQYGGDDNADVVVGIGVINEPLMSELPGGRGALTQYYEESFSTVRNYGQAAVIIGDAFVPPSSWNGVLTGQGTSGAIVGHHEYQIFDEDQLKYTYQQHVDEVTTSANDWASGVDKFLVCGEWTGAMTDCAKYLNGYGVGARYDGTYTLDGGSSYIGSCSGKSDISTWDQAMRDGTTAYIKAQIDVFSAKTQGWIFWNFKTEGAGEWDMFRLQENGIWPQ